MKTFFSYFFFFCSWLYIAVSFFLHDYGFVGLLVIFFGIYLFFQVIRFLFVKKFSFAEIVSSTYKMMRIIFGFAGFILFILIAFTTYHTLISPGKLSNIEISNGTQKVEFLQMSHIATEQFYSDKKSQIQSLVEQKYHFLLEGVGSGTTENLEKFQKYMGMEFNDALYPKIAKYLGMQAQSRDLYADIPVEQLHFIDTSIDTIVALLDEKKAPQRENSMDIHRVLDEIQKNQNPNERLFGGYLIRGILNIMLKSNSLASTLSTDPETAPLMQVILHERDKPITHYIQSNTGQSIAVIYGALHFDGVFAELKKSDPNWKIIKTSPYTPYFDTNYLKNLRQNLLSWQLFVYSVLTFLILYLFHFYVKKLGQQINSKTPKTPC